MNCKVFESDLAVSVKFKKGSAFKIAAVFLPIVFLLIVMSVTASIVLEISILMIFAAILMMVLPMLIYFRLAYTNIYPAKTLSEIINTPGANVALAMDSSAIDILMIAEGAVAKNGGGLQPFWLMYGFLSDPEGRELFYRLGMFFNEKNLENMKDVLAPNSGDMVDLLAKAVEFATKNGDKYLAAEDLLVGMLSTGSWFQDILNPINVDEKAIVDVALWHKRLRKERSQVAFWEKPVVGGIGQDWAYGYTPSLSQYALNLTNVAAFSGQHIELFSRSSYVETMEQLLAKSGQNNVLLVGDYGVGKKTMVMALAQKIGSGSIHPALRYKQIMQVNVGSLLAGSQTQGDIVQRVEMLLYEATRAGNIILFFEDFHALVSSQQTVGSINAAEILLPYLNSTRVQVIGSTTIDRYHKDIEAASGMIDVFTKIDVPEPSGEEAMKMLEESIYQIEYKYSVLFIYQALNEIVRLSERYVHDKPFPQKALDMASEVAVKVSATKNTIITDKDVQEIVSARTHVPVGQVNASEKDKLLNLENILHQKVIGQEEAVVAVANAMRRSRSGLSSGKRPIGNFLFIGPTGVGKTEMAKALASAYFGDEKRMIRFDMSEYQDNASIYNLIGAPAGPGTEGSPGQLTSAVHDNPFSLILLDELEKAHPSLLTLFLQVFDDGRLTAGNGKTVDFTNTIIIATSNAGSEVVRQYLASGQNDTETLKTQLLEYLQTKGIYRPEFLNRFDGVIVFRPLTIDEITKVAGLMLQDLNKQLENRGISITVAPDALEYLVQKGYDPVFGARPMRRVIQDKVENVLAKKLLTEKLDRGAVINLTLQDLSA